MNNVFLYIRRECLLATITFSGGHAFLETCSGHKLASFPYLAKREHDGLSIADIGRNNDIADALLSEGTAPLKQVTLDVSSNKKMCEDAG